METINRKVTEGPNVPSHKVPRDRVLSDRVYERVLAMIAEGEVQVGMKLPTEEALSKQFEVSRPVLRQALKQLREDLSLIHI